MKDKDSLPWSQQPATCPHQSNPVSPILLWYILILYSHLHLVLPSHLFPSPKPCMRLSSNRTCRMPDRDDHPNRNQTSETLSPQLTSWITTLSKATVIQRRLMELVNSKLVKRKRSCLRYLLPYSVPPQAREGILASHRTHFGEAEELATWSSGCSKRTLVTVYMLQPVMRP